MLRNSGIYTVPNRNQSVPTLIDYSRQKIKWALKIIKSNLNY